MPHAPTPPVAALNGLEPALSWAVVQPCPMTSVLLIVDFGWECIQSSVASEALIDGFGIGVKIWLKMARSNVSKNALLFFKRKQQEINALRLLCFILLRSVIWLRLGLDFGLRLFRQLLGLLGLLCSIAYQDLSVCLLFPFSFIISLPLPALFLRHRSPRSPHLTSFAFAAYLVYFYL